MRVAHVVSSFPPASYHGGPIQSTFGLCRALARLGCEVRVWTTNTDGPGRRIDVPLRQDVELEDRFTVRYYPTLTDRTFAPRLLLELRRLVDWCDVVHVTGIYEHHTIPALALCKLTDRALVWSARGALQRWEHVRRVRLKATWELACHVAVPNHCVLHVTSDQEARDSRKRFPNLDTAILPNGVEIPELPIEGEDHNSRGTFHLVALGRLDPIKGLERLLEAGQILNQGNFGPWRLTIAGDGPQQYREALEAEAAHRGLDHHVTFVGHVSGLNKSRLLRSADAVVVPSYLENFGIVIAEALAHARPVIASTGTPWEALETNQCGRWVPNDPHSLADAIRALRRHDLVAMGQRGRDWMQRAFTWHVVAQRMLDVYRSVRCSAEAQRA